MVVVTHAPREWHVATEAAAQPSRARAILAAMARPTPPEHDDSQPLNPSSYPLVRVWRAEAGAFEDPVVAWSGVVTRISTLEDGKSERFDLVDAQGRPVAPLGLQLPEEARRPKVGERIQVRVRARVLGIHPVLEGSVVDEQGELIAATVDDSHAQLLPPTWTVSEGPIATREPARSSSMAESLSPWVIVRHRERAAWVQGGEWRSLDDYWIGGRAQSWGFGNLVPDASSYMSAWIARIA
jgi:hypothetical protein